jgi:hypothetical protein
VTPLNVVKEIGSYLSIRPVVLAVRPLTFGHLKKLSAAALSAQLPTALMLEVT